MAEDGISTHPFNGVHLKNFLVSWSPSSGLPVPSSFARFTTHLPLCCARHTLALLTLSALSNMRFSASYFAALATTAITLVRTHGNIDKIVINNNAFVGFLPYERVLFLYHW